MPVLKCGPVVWNKNSGWQARGEFHQVQEAIFKASIKTTAKLRELVYRPSSLRGKQSSALLASETTREFKHRSELIWWMWNHSKKIHLCFWHSILKGREAFLYLKQISIQIVKNVKVHFSLGGHVQICVKSMCFVPQFSTDASSGRHLGTSEEQIQPYFWIRWQSTFTTILLLCCT